MSESETSIELVLCIPGEWADRSELVTRIVSESEGYIFAGNILLHIESKQGIELQFEGRDERMPNAFQAAGYQTIGDRPQLIYLWLRHQLMQGVMHHERDTHNK